MSDVKTSTLWRHTDTTIDAESPDLDTVTFFLEANGKQFAVALVAPKRASAIEYCGALRAAAAVYTRAAGGDMADVGVAEPDATFDTGSQRAN